MEAIKNMARNKSLSKIARNQFLKITKRLETGIRNSMTG